MSFSLTVVTVKKVLIKKEDKKDREWFTVPHPQTVIFTASSKNSVLSL